MSYRHLITYLLIMCTWCCDSVAQTGGSAGAFSRMGFGARGMAMGNALTGVTNGELSSYYNPATSSFSGTPTIAATFGILSLDRHLNFLSYTQPLQPLAGLSVGIINAGVTNIDGRDGDGNHTEEYSTFENQFYLSFSNRVDERVSLGVTVKLLHSKLFEDVKSTTVGFDLGGVIIISDQLSLGLAVIDINSKYKWDTKSIYDANGRTTDEKFPNLRRVGIAYRLPANSGVISAEFENSSDKTSLLKLGAEVVLHDNFAVRGGMDRWDLSDDATGIKPAFGFSIRNSFHGWSPSLTYAFLTESFAPRGIHVLTLSTSF